MQCEVLGAVVAVGACEREQLLRELLGSLDLALGDQNLADADECTRLDPAIAQCAPDGEALVEGAQRLDVVLPAEEQHPAECIERR